MYQLTRSSPDDIQDMETLSTLPVTGGFPSQRASNLERCFTLYSEAGQAVELSQVASDLKCHETHVAPVSGLILGLCPANERRRYKVTPSLIGWAQT